jgi:hypothetical protein
MGEERGTGHKGVSIEVREATLAMLLVFPEMDAKVRDPALVARCMAARP